jgi:putative CRISPR-associated protein (TIGR02619 family)
MPNYIVSTCGTSLLTNSVSKQANHQLNELTNKKETELSSDEKKIIDDLVEQVSEQLKQTKSNDIQELRKKSAELNTILGFYGNQMAKGKNDYHLLLHTDTYEGTQTAKLLEQWLKSQHIENVECHQCENLTTVDTKSFQHGIAKLVTDLTERLSALLEKQQYRIIFQLSGGFKALKGFMQTLGMFFEHEIIYIF